MPEPSTPPSIVVGVDGSRGALRAALWAIEEAVSRDIPLRLVYAQDDDRQLAAAELAVSHAADAVVATEWPVKLESEIRQGRPIATLVEASRCAAMICVGEVGLKHFDSDRIGSTATALVTSAYCPIAIVRGEDRNAGHDPGWIVVELDESPDSAAVLQFGVAEARLRGAPLRVLGSWQSRYTDVHDSHAVSDGNRIVRAQLDRRLSH
jgi:nucleotide-binding universal stress UspA family protein